MNIKKLEEKNDTIKLLIKNSNNSFMNALRRAIMTLVPTLAIDDVSIYKNDSVMFDEMLAHRLGMLVIKTDLKAYKKGDKVKFTLKEKGPKTVYSRDIKCIDPKIEIAHKNVPIVKLKEGQEIKLEMTATMNSGKEHTKWSPALVSFKEVPELIQKEKIDNAKEIVEKCPMKVLELKAGKIILKEAYNCSLCDYCVDLSEDKLSLEFNGKDFVLTVESFGALEPKEIIIAAANELKEKLKELNENLSKI